LSGINTTLTYSGIDNFTPIFDLTGNFISSKDLHQEQDIYTAANGQSIILHFANQQTQYLTMNSVGTFTGVNTYKGLPEQLMSPNGPY